MDEEKRSHKALDRDIKALKHCIIALENATPRMRKPTLEFLWDKYVRHPTVEADASPDQ